MALLTLGSNANNSLSAIKYLPGIGSMVAADLATLNIGIKDDINVAHPNVQSCFRDGMLFIPNRGWVQVLPGDYVAYDTTTGWPILLSAYAIASGPWTHS